jgi:Tol biopolymer transport system component
MQQLPGTEGAANPFWSADSRFIAFFSEDGKLKKIDPAGGPPQIICDAPVGVCAGTWSKDGVILFYKQQEGIYRVDAGGGEPVQVTRSDVSRQELLHLWPYFLPDGRHFLYCAANKKRDAYKIYVASLDTGETTPLLQANSRVAYAPPGYLLYVRDATLLAQAFDLRTLRLSGEPIAVAEDLSYFNPTGDADFSVSENGVLAFKAGAIISRLTWFDRQGVGQGLVGEPGRYGTLRLSPDGQRLAADVIDPRTGTSDIWIYELPRGTSSRVTVDIEQEFGANWSPDKHQLVFAKDKEGPPHLFLKDLNNSNEAEELVPLSGGVQSPDDWSANGQFLIYEDQNPGTGSDLWLLPMTGERRPSAFLRTRFNEWNARLSQDGRWVAYVSDESGRPEVYVCNFGNSSERWQISTSGGNAPRWRSDGKELFYVAADSTLMAVAVRSGATFAAGPPTALFKVEAERSSFYDVTADGQRFLVNTRTDAQPLPITVVINWTSQLK